MNFKKIELNRQELRLMINLLNENINKLSNKKNSLNKKLKKQGLCRVEKINLNLYSDQLHKSKKILRKINQN